MNERAREPSHDQASPKIFFLHIPKVAGTSIREDIFKTLGDRMFWHSLQTPFHDQSLNDLATKRVVGGHIALYDPMTEAFEKKVGAENCIYLAAFREPVSHLISHFYHIKKHPTHHLYTDKSLVEALEQKLPFFQGSQNLQTGYLVQSKLAKDAFQAMSQRRYVFSTLESIEPFSNAIRGMLGMPPEPLIQENVGNKSEKSSDELDAAREYCNEYCREDLFLYNFIKSKEIWSNVDIA